MPDRKSILLPFGKILVGASIMMGVVSLCAAADRIESLSGFGDEAFYRVTRIDSDKYDIWVRKNDKVFALSLLGSPAKASLDEHKLLAKKIASEL